MDFFFIYSATLKIKDGAQNKAFTSPSEAEDFVRAALDPCSGSPGTMTNLFVTGSWCVDCVYVSALEQPGVFALLVAGVCPGDKLLCFVCDYVNLC